MSPTNVCFVVVCQWQNACDVLALHFNVQQGPSKDLQFQIILKALLPFEGTSNASHMRCQFL